MFLYYSFHRHYSYPRTLNSPHPFLFYLQIRKRPAFTAEAVTWVFLLFESFVFSSLSVCLMTGNDKTLSVHMGNKSRLTEAEKLPKLWETLNKHGLKRHIKRILISEPFKQTIFLVYNKIIRLSSELVGTTAMLREEVKDLHKKT